MSFVYEYNVFTDAKNGVHVVGVDDGGDIVFMRNVAQEFVNQNGSTRVESGVGLIAK